MRYLRASLFLAVLLLCCSVAGMAAPTISSLTPSAGAVGFLVVKAGTNFGSTASGNTVKFNGTGAVLTAWSPTSVTAVVPPGATTRSVVVTVGGHASNGVTFTVTPAPSIGSLSATSGIPGVSVNINGANFGSSQGNGGVTFNGTPAHITNWGSSLIAVTVPVGAGTGNVVVTATGEQAIKPSGSRLGRSVFK